MAILGMVISAFLALAVVIGFPLAMYAMGRMIADPFIQAQRRDRARAVATSPAIRQRHLVLVKSTNAGDTPNAA